MKESSEASPANNKGPTLISPLKETETKSGSVDQEKPKSDTPASSIIKLNVGGERFTTSKATLCRVKGSTLEAMFSGRHALAAIQDEQDGSYFIDRDGTHFRHILNFLRVGAVVSLPSQAKEKEELAIEADYYGLEDLVKSLRMPKVDISEHLSEQVLIQRNDERRYRQAFASDQPSGLNGHCGLISLFEPDNGVSLKYEGVQAGSEHIAMANLRGRPGIEDTKMGVPVAVPTLDEFQTNFNRKHPNVLHRLSDVLSEEPVIIAGGSVLHALTSGSSIRTANWWGETSDIDLFAHSCNAGEASRIAKRIFDSLAVDMEHWVVVRSRGVINIHCWNERRSELGEKVQIVLRLYESPAEVVYGFDCDCCCCAYDGQNVWVTPRCLLALQTGVNVLNPLHSWPHKASYELRLAKYAARGFAVLVPGLEQDRVDYDRINGQDLSKLKGMARFLKVAFAMETAEPLYWPLRSKVPKEIDTLNVSVKECYTADERVLLGLDGYDELGSPLIVPRVYVAYAEDSTGLDEPCGLMWFDHIGTFPPSVDSREEAWAEIVDSGGAAPENIPSKLVDAWDSGKRSREYLNDDMDSFDLDNIYYSQAYRSA